ncbi:estradiol 17-beta-dehydrogenase 11-like isoform X1 [Amphiura filiformis]|uniref:estradiol 17-beta-dehydrogenase 11-like isoform X1 n=1 Tax=Amphiura filiformis TaxID=82378 RepID=UPI003B2111C3
MSLLSDIGVLIGQIILGWLEVFARLFVSPARKDVTGRIILITGAGHGFGRMMAHRFAKLGAKLVLWDVNKEGNEQTAREAKEFGATVFTYTVDCSKREDIYETGEKVKKDVGQVYMLINNAGVLAGRTLLELTDEQIQRTMDVNVMAHFWTLRSFLPAMLDSNEGHLVCICSVAGKVGGHRLTDYTAAKHATLGLHDSIQQEIRVVYKKTGIKTTLVYPYFTNTGIIHEPGMRFGKMMDQEPVSDQIVDAILREKADVYIPADWRFNCLVRDLVPQRVYEAMQDFFKVEIPTQPDKEK